MKKLGLIGGVGPESTVPYYKGIVFGVKDRVGHDFFPRITIESMSCFDVVPMSVAGKKQELVDYFLDGIKSLAAAGCDFAALSCYTGHMVFEELEKVSPIPLVSIVEATLDEAKKRGYKRVLLLGTKATMEDGFFQKPFLRDGVDVVTPDAATRDWVADHIMNELEQGIVKDDTAAAFREIALSLMRQHDADALVLGCTELPMVFSKYSDIPQLDGVQIHVNALVDRILSD